MSDKNKLGLVKQLIDNYYEFFSTTDDAKNGDRLEVVLDSIYTILTWEDGADDNCGGCSCHGASA